jgi:hypothetical protein
MAQMKNGERKTRRSVAAHIDAEKVNQQAVNSREAADPNRGKKNKGEATTALSVQTDVNSEDDELQPVTPDGSMTIPSEKAAVKRKRKNDKVSSTKRKGREVVHEWLHSAFPDCNDLTRYVDRLVKDGYETGEMIEKFLTEKDLDFMPKAYQRAAWLAKPSSEGDEKRQIVDTWISSAVPSLDQHDRNFYATRLINDGFYSTAMLKKIEESDLDFMKRAHKKQVVLSHKWAKKH